MKLDFSFFVWVCSKNRTDNFCSARANQTIQSENFSFMKIEGNIPYFMIGKPFYFEDFFIIQRFCFCIFVFLTLAPVMYSTR